MKKKLKSSEWTMLILVLIVIPDMNRADMGILDWIILALSAVLVGLMGYGLFKKEE